MGVFLLQYGVGGLKFPGTRGDYYNVACAQMLGTHHWALLGICSALVLSSLLCVIRFQITISGVCYRDPHFQGTKDVSPDNRTHLFIPTGGSVPHV